VYAQAYPKRHDNTLQQNHVRKEELDDVKHNLTGINDGVKVERANFA
jgi:hypothetical protein